MQTLFTVIYNIKIPKKGEVLADGCSIKVEKISDFAGTHFFLG